VHDVEKSVSGVGAEGSAVAKHPSYTRSIMQLSKYTVELTALEGVSARISGMVGIRNC
jgi:hypothetical protein